MPTHLNDCKTSKLTLWRKKDFALGVSLQIIISEYRKVIVPQKELLWPVGDAEGSYPISIPCSHKN